MGGKGGCPSKSELKVNLNRIYTMLPEDWLKQLQSVYPKRPGGQGWGYVKRRIPELIKDGHSFDDILSGAKNYGDYCRLTNEQYVRMARTFFGPDEWWLEEYDLPQAREYWKPEVLSDEQKKLEAEKANKVLDMLQFKSAK